MASFDEGQEVMFAHRIKLDVFDENDLARVGVEDRIVHDLLDALSITLSEKLKSPGRQHGGFPQALTLHIFADSFENFAKRIRQRVKAGTTETVGLARPAL